MTQSKLDPKRDRSWYRWLIIADRVNVHRTLPCHFLPQRISGKGWRNCKIRTEVACFTSSSYEVA